MENDFIVENTGKPRKNSKYSKGYSENVSSVTPCFPHFFVGDVPRKTRKQAQKKEDCCELGRVSGVPRI